MINLNGNTSLGQKDDERRRYRLTVSAEGRRSQRDAIIASWRSGFSEQEDDYLGEVVGDLVNGVKLYNPSAQFSRAQADEAIMAIVNLVVEVGE